MFLCRFRHIFLMLLIAGALGIRAEAQSPLRDGLVNKFNSFLPIDHSRPMTIAELCHRLDCINDELRNDGLVVLKQPDVFSQARMTRFRNDFEGQMNTDLANFHLVLAARINRLDSATTTSTTALGASLAAPGTTNVQAPPANAASILGSSNNNLFPNTGVPTLFGTTTPIPSQGAFAQLGLGSNNFSSASATASSPLGLGVDPTVYLDEKKRFLEALNQIRRINLGPDQNDSSGYGLYLVRLPVSITPGECTYQGHGADLSVTVEHEFTPDFLPQTFQNLVTNDIVDELGPAIYEAIRSGFYDSVLKPRHEAKIRQRALKTKTDQLLDLLNANTNRRFLNTTFGRGNAAISRPPAGVGARMPTPTVPADLIAQPLADYILRTGKPAPDDPAKALLIAATIADRLTVLLEAREKLSLSAEDVAGFKEKIAAIRRGQAMDFAFKMGVLEFARTLVDADVQGGVPAQGTVPPPLTLPIDLSKVDYRRFRPFIRGLYATALPDDVTILDNLIGLNDQERNQITHALANYNEQLNRPDDGRLNNISLPSVRTPKQLYPIAPRELKDFFLEENLYLLAKDALEASRVKQIRATEVRDYLRHTLETAYRAMSFPTAKDAATIPPLQDDVFMHELMDAIRERRFGRSHDGGSPRLERLYDYLVEKLEEGRDNIRDRPIAALCWAIAVQRSNPRPGSPRRCAESPDGQGPALRGYRGRPLPLPQAHTERTGQGRVSGLRDEPLADHHLRPRPGHRPAEHRRLGQPEPRLAARGLVRVRHRADQFQPAQHLPPPDPAVGRCHRPQSHGNRIRPQQRHLRIPLHSPVPERTQSED